MANPIFKDKLRVHVQGQHKLSKAQSAMVRAAFNDGVGLPGTVRFGCRMAEDVWAAIENGVEDGGKFYFPNPKVRPQFGKNKRGRAYLTFGLIGEHDGVPLTLTIEGDAVPVKMKRVAVEHDEGRNVNAVTIQIDLSLATVHETGAKTPDQATQKQRDKRRNHDTGKDDKPYPRPPRPNHNRICRGDL